MAEAGRGRSGTVDSFVVDNSKPLEEQQGASRVATKSKKEESADPALPVPLAVDQLRILLSPEEQEIFDLLNFVRANPASFALRLEEEYLPFVGDDNVLRFPGATVLIKTKEGKEAVENAIQYLREMEDEERQPLVIAHGLLLGTQDHVGDQWMDEDASTGHVGTDQSNSRTRADRYGAWEHSIGESLCYGAQEPFRIVSKWIIDDGLEARTNRKNILTKESSFMGIAMGAHRGQGNCIVLVICQSYENDQVKLQQQNPKLAKDYKSAKKRKWYGKNKATTKTKTTSTERYEKKGCAVM